MIGVGLIGYGYWGPNLARNLARVSGAQLVAIVDTDASRRALAEHDYPAARIETDADQVIGAPEVNAIMIATPPAQHRDLALAALHQKHHVLIEKPFANDLAESRAIAAAADDQVVLMVDYTFVFAPAVQALAAVLTAGGLGELIFIECMRTNLARFDPAIGVIRDLAVHDLSILQYLLGRTPLAVSARGPHAENGPEAVAFLALDYGDGLLVHLHVNCISPLKICRITIGGARGLVIYDDIEPVEKIKEFERGQSMSQAELRTGYRSGVTRVASVAPEEPLARAVSHFIDCIRTGTKPITDAAFALRLAAAADAAERSFACRGMLTTVEDA